MKIALMRHPAPLIEPGVCYGRLDVALTPAAEAMVSKLGLHPDLHGVTRVWSSPARRCRGPAEAIGRTLAVPLTIDPRLQELDFGAWEGKPWDAIDRTEVDRWAESPLTSAPPDGESGAMLIARVQAFQADLRQTGKDCVVVSHGGPLKVLAAVLLGRSIDLLAAAPPWGSVMVVTCAPL